jgi:hypothetical protein
MTVVNQKYRKLNPSGSQPREISEVVNNMMDGKTNNTGYFSTTQSATTTTIYNERFGTDSAIIFTPMNDKAASEMAKLWIGTRSKGSVVINHDSNAHVCNFMYIIVG